jgi:hypothetical protein
LKTSRTRETKANFVPAPSTVSARLTGAQDYGEAASCYTDFNAAGTANIDLRGTPFAITGGGACGSYRPTNLVIPLVQQ